MSVTRRDRPALGLSSVFGAFGIACLVLCAVAPSAFGFGITSFRADFRSDENGSAATQAGSHPYLASATIDFETEERGGKKVTRGDVKNVDVELPAGLIGDPSATPTCEQANIQLKTCPANTQVGYLRVTLGSSLGPAREPLYNVTPPPGMPAELAALVDGQAPVLVTVSVRPASPGSAEGYGIDLHIHEITQLTQIYSASLEFLGVPPGSEGRKPFVTLPTSCGGPLPIRLHAESWQGDSTSVSTLVPDPGGKPVTVTGCDLVPFGPQVSTGLDTTATDSPSGLDVDIKTPQQTNAAAIATANLRSTTVALPAGVSVNLAAAGGRVGCSIAQFDQFSEVPSTCPDAAKIGSVEIDSPLVRDPLEGGVYLARQTENPFGSLIALYLIAEADGIRVKLPGSVVENPSTGQVTATFDETPQLPFEELQIHFFDGPRAPLATPVVCGTQPVAASLSPWSGQPPTTLSGSLTVSSGTGGSACPSSPGARPFGLSFEAGTVSPAAALHSPFALMVTRPDGAQELGRIDTTLPEGVLATLKGVPECSSSDAAAGTCGASSQVDSVIVGAGAGPMPYSVKGGLAYLTGPYGGAPLGLEFVVPAVAGPLNLGTVNVRAALFVDPETTQVTVKSDPLPKILQGIPLRLRSVAIGVDRPGFIVNPTSCDPTQVTGQVTSTEGATANLSDRFQAAGCGGLGFKPKMTPKLLGGRKTLRRGGHPKLRVTLEEPDGQANLSSVSLALPRSILLDQNHIRTVCTRVQFAAEACPTSSVYGTAKVTSPLLDKPLDGPVYLRSSSHTLPDLVFDLRGQIRLVLAGRIDSHKGGIRVSFGQIPDAAVGTFVLNMKGGAKGLLQPSVDLCKAKAKARTTTVRTAGQNGALSDSRPQLATSCRKPKEKKKR